uniref:Uncharacterized protein n=1 Tax=Parascaris equorum TaxID=6256 RepID=A0A914RJI5_PAREQ
MLLSAHCCCIQSMYSSNTPNSPTTSRKLLPNISRCCAGSLFGMSRWMRD